MPRNNAAKTIALGGVMAALAVVIMCLGGLIPVATYTCPMLVILLLGVILRLCGHRVAWAWYGAVAILSLLLGPDKEAAAIFLALGYYPMIKPKLDRIKLGWMLKALLFNGSVLILYWLLINLMGMEALSEEFRDLGLWMLAAMMTAGNVIFFLLDRLLEKKFVKKTRGG